MALLEIERKFIFHPSLLRRFCRNEGTPPFTKLQYLGSQKIHDVYFDMRAPSNMTGILERHGIWVRQRDNAWQAKQRAPANTQHDQHVPSKSETADPALEKNEQSYLRTIFNELSCPRAIHNLVKTYIPSSPAADHNFGLRPIADFTTSRETFLVDDHFQVVLDETCFGHRVGEVEVSAEWGSESQAQRDIDGFMEKYRWFFLAGGSDKEDGEPAVLKGKLTAYFERFPVRF